MLGDSAVLGTGGGGGGSSGDAAVAAAAASAGGAHDGGDTAAGGGGSNSGDDERGRGEEGDRSFGGNRWPRQETLALLKIRSDMGIAFRDASIKGPLWEEVSRKMAELGYHRNAKKCKEKFENVYKYHKRTKEGRSGKSDGKTYRFFDQLEALENNPAIQSPTPLKPLPATPVSVVVTSASLPSLPTTAATTISTTTTVPVPLPPLSNTNNIPPTTTTTVPSHSTTVPSTTTTPLPISIPQVQGILNTPPINLTIPSFPPQPPSSNPTYFPNPTTIPPYTITPPSFPTDLLSNSSSSSTSSEETTTMEGGRRKRKRKWKDFFERLMKEVMEKQEELQKRFLEAIEKRERDRVAREEAWRVQEMQRINREREILAQERSIAAAKDAAVMAFLQKIAEQQNLGTPLNNTNNIPQPVPQETTPTPTPTPTPPQLQTPTPTIATPTPTPPIPQAPPLAPQQQHQVQVQVQQQQQQQQQVTNMEIIKSDNGESVMTASSSRWPKVEVQALINLRTSLETKYQDSGPKGPLWEEISALMKKMGYNRNAKRCKEKWENINKYFKKVKESNKKRPEDSKTCPYFHQLDALYRERTNKMEKPDGTMMAPLMVRPEQQWPPQQTTVPDVTMEDAGNDPRQHREEEEYDDDNDDDDKDVGGEEDDEDEDENGGENFEIVASKPASVDASAE